MASKNAGGGGSEKRVCVDIVIVGAGPATLGLLTNACKTNRLNELVQKGEGLAVIDQGLSFGGGTLEDFGINSNTSANGFIKCLYKRRELPNLQQAQAAVNIASGQSASGSQANKGVVTQGNNAHPKRFLKAGSGVPATTAAAENPNASPLRTKLKDMMNQGLDEGDDSDDAEDEEDVYQPKKYEYVALNPFKDLYKQSPLIQMSFEFGPSCIPLSTCGMIMNYTGNHLLHFIHSIMGKRIFYPCHKVVSVQLMQNGDILTTALRKEISIVLNTNNDNAQGTNKSSPPPQGAAADKESPEIATGSESLAASSSHDPADKSPFKIVSHGETQVTFRSKAIVLSNGGQQNLHPDFYTNWFPSLADRREDVVCSDYVLKRHGFRETIKRIKTQNKKKIVIIGGSHSGFSTAWILLNGPADILHNTHVKPTVQHVKNNTGKFSFPGAPMRSIDNCARCCVCQMLKKKDRPKTCKCQCKCYGFFRYEDWGVDYDSLPQFGDADITILYRDRIRVFYSRVHMAQAEGYADFKGLQYSNKNGFLYSFTGLRGDAKRLYKAIKNGSETRVRLVKAMTPAEQAKYVETADLVVWACGYQTNRIPVKDVDNKVITMSAKVPFTQFDVDQRCRIITSDNGLLMKTFGTGLAYPVRTNDGMVMPEAGRVNPRADSFSLYMNYVANTLLSNLLPKTRLMMKGHRTVRVASKKTTAAQALVAERAANANINTQAGLRGTQGANTTVGNSNNWVRSGSEQTSSAQRSSSYMRPIVSKPPGVTATNNIQSVNLSKVVPQSSPKKTPIKTTPAKASVTPSSSNNPPVKQSSQSVASSGLMEEIPEVENYESSQPIPGYLQSNYITEQRKKAAGNAEGKGSKKRTWVPSSQYSGAPINKIPKTTAKALETRIAAEHQKQSVNLDSTIGSTNAQILTQEVKVPTTIQMHLSESGKAYQAVSQSFSMLKTTGGGSTTSNVVVVPQSRYTLKTTEFMGKFPSETLGHQVGASPPEFLKNISASAQSYGVGQVATQNNNAMLIAEKTASLERHVNSYSTPQKHSSGKAGAQHGFANSPLIYQQSQPKVIDNTPQVHKRKASYKMAKQSAPKQEDFAAYTAAILSEKQKSPVKPRDSSMITPFNNSTQIEQVQQLQQQPGIAKSLHSIGFTSAPTQESPLVKPVSQSIQKRHSATANQGPHQSASSHPNGSKKKSASKQIVRNGRSGVSNLIQGGHGNPSSQVSTEHTTALSSSNNQQSSPNLHHKQKRAGTFLKNCKTKYQGQGSSPIKNAGTESKNASPEKNLSNLASAGQRQIFSDESGSMSSTAKRLPFQDPGSTTTNTFDVQKQQISALDCKLQMHQTGTAIVSKTPMSPNQYNPQSLGSAQKAVHSSHSNKRNAHPAHNLQQMASEQEQRNLPMSGNFVSSEDTLANQTSSYAQQRTVNSPTVIAKNQPGIQLIEQDMQRRLQQQRSDFSAFQERDKLELRAHQNQENQAVGSFDEQPNKPLHTDFGIGQTSGQAIVPQMNQMRELNFPVNRAAVGVNEITRSELQTQSQQVSSPTHSVTQNNGRRSASRVKSVSRTHRSLSKGQVTASPSQPINDTEVESFSKAVEGNHVAGQVQSRRDSHEVKNGAQAQQQQAMKPYMQNQVRDKNFENNGIYSLAPQDASIIKKQNTVTIFSNNASPPTFNTDQSAAAYASQQRRTSFNGQPDNTNMQMGSGQGGRLGNTLQQHSTSIVPVKIFQLPVQKQGAANKSNAAMQTHYMQQVMLGGQNLSTQQVLLQQQQQQQQFTASQNQQKVIKNGNTQYQHVQRASGPPVSPPQPQSGHKKQFSSSNSGQQHFTAMAQPKTIQLVSQGGSGQQQPSMTGQNGSIIPKQMAVTRNFVAPGNHSPPKSIMIDPQKVVQLQQKGVSPQIKQAAAQYTYMQMAHGQKKSQNLLTSQPLQTQAVTLGGGGSINNSVFVRKSVPSQMYSASPVKTTLSKVQQMQAVNTYHHRPQASTYTSPLKQHQKAQVVSYTQAQLNHANAMQQQQQQHSLTMTRQAQSSGTPVPNGMPGMPQQRSFEINSPLTLKTRPPLNTVEVANTNTGHVAVVPTAAEGTS